MICGTCNADVQPVKQLRQVASCSACGTHITGVREVERPVICPSCSSTAPPALTMGMVNICPVDVCRAMMPDAPKPSMAIAAPQLAKEAPAILVKPPWQHVALEAFTGQLRARLATIEAEVTRLEDLKAEAATIRRMLDAATLVP